MVDTNNTAVDTNSTTVDKTTRQYIKQHDGRYNTTLDINNATVDTNLYDGRSQNIVILIQDSRSLTEPRIKNLMNVI